MGRAAWRLACPNEYGGAPRANRNRRSGLGQGVDVMSFKFRQLVDQMQQMSDAWCLCVCVCLLVRQETRAETVVSVGGSWRRRRR